MGTEGRGTGCFLTLLTQLPPCPHPALAERPLRPQLGVQSAGRHRACEGSQRSCTLPAFPGSLLLEGHRLWPPGSLSMVKEADGSRLPTCLLTGRGDWRNSQA